MAIGLLLSPSRFFGFDAHNAWGQEEKETNDARGVVVGAIIDASTSAGIADAGINVIGSDDRTRTDLDGKFRIELEPGTYELRVSASRFRGKRLRNVVVAPGGVTRVEAALELEGPKGVEVLEVVAEAVTASDMAQLIKRKMSATVTDNIGAQMIQKAPDSSAAEIVTRLPAITIKDDYVSVRGLGERYSSAVLNGSRLPSTDPNRRVVPLDLFPTEFIESIGIVKSYTPDLPGDFSGGLVNIELKEAPDAAFYKLGLSTGFNTEATFQEFDTYEGTAADYFGLGSSFRALPGILGDDVLEPRAPASTARVRALGSSFDNIWEVDSRTASPNYDVNASFGNTFGPLGVSLGGVYGTRHEVRRDEILRTVDQSGESQAGGTNDPRIDQDFVYDRSTFETRLAGLMNVGWAIDLDHKLTLRALVNHQSEDEVLSGQGMTENTDDQTLFQDRLSYTEERLGLGQLSGRHRLPWLEIEWRSALSQTIQDAPDTRFVIFKQEPGGAKILSPQPPNLLRAFSDLEEWMTDSAIDLSVPFPVWLEQRAKFKSGVAYTLRRRDFRFRRFFFTLDRYNPVPGRDDPPPETLLRPHNLGSVLGFREDTAAADAFEASHEIAGVYGMIDVPIIPEWLRVVGGVRGEYSYITADGFDRQSNPIGPRIRDLDPIPGVNVIVNPGREDMNVRYSFSRTVSRPEFRELTPTEFPVPGGERTVIGNPDLVSSTIDSHDIRWEWFLSGTEILSAGFFYKDLTEPIERIATAQTSREADSFRNADTATVFGFEIEARKNMSFVGDWLYDEPRWKGIAPLVDPLGFMVNVSWIESTVELGERQATEVQTTTERELQGQAPFVVNAAVEYEDPDWGTTRLLYNTVGRRIVAAGVNNLPDIYEERRDKLDFVYLSRPLEVFGRDLSFKFSVENILNDDYVETQDEFVIHQYKSGVTFGLSMSSSF